MIMDTETDIWKKIYKYDFLLKGSRFSIKRLKKYTLLSN